MNKQAASPRYRYETVRLSGTTVRGSNGSPLEGVLVIAEEMASGERHHGESDDFGDFCLEGLPKDRMYEVKLGKKGIIPTFFTLFLSGDKDLGTMVLRSWAFNATGSPPSRISCSPTPQKAK